MSISREPAPEPAAGTERDAGGRATPEPGLPFFGVRRALGPMLRCVGASIALIARRRIHRSAEHVGWQLCFADGSSATVYRETVVRRPPTQAPAVLAVTFRLHWIRGRGHALFKAESLLNTVLFVGFPGFVSKLWLDHDQRGRYRGIYEWDDPRLAHAYARALGRVLLLVSVPGSVSYVVLPGRRPHELLSDTLADAEADVDADADADADGGEWWRVVEASDGTAVPERRK